MQLKDKPIESTGFRLVDLIVGLSGVVAFLIMISFAIGLGWVLLTVLYHIAGNIGG